MPPYFQKFFSPAEFAARRALVAERIGAGAIAVLPGGGERGSFEFFRQYNEFFYLSGVESPHAYLKIDDAEILTVGAPFEIDEIEAVVGRGGMLQNFPPQLGAS